MRLPKTFLKTKLFELGRTVLVKPKKKFLDFYYRKINWWITIYGVRFRHHGYYIMLKKVCF